MYSDPWKGDSAMDYSASGSDSEVAEAPSRNAKGRNTPGQMRNCSGCGQSMPKRAFSGNQWRKGPSASTCTSCVQERGDSRQAPPQQKTNQAARQGGQQRANQAPRQVRQGGTPWDEDPAPPRSAPRQPTAAPPPPVRKFNPNSRTSSTTLSQITESKFADLPVGMELRRACADILGYEFMSKVQAQTIGVSLRGVDVLARAKTGTGKTLAFLVPAVERLRTQGRRSDSVGGLIISPTRELATQIAEEAKMLLHFLPDLRLQVVFGGTNIRTDLSKLKRRAPDILVATPGRLNDLLENHGLREQMRALSVMVFDEADQLLEMGFRPAITQMLNMLPPKQTRQTLLFSATMPADIMGIARFALRESFEHIDCVGEEQSTHQHVAQSVLVHPLETQIVELAFVLKEAMALDPDDFKVICFFTTARLTQFFAELFNLMPGGEFRVLEIHSRKSQATRTKVSDRFRTGNRLILFTSDVSARGMDYPDVTRIVQVGLPSDKNQYVHRLGRTARAGKTGDGVLLLADFERSFLGACRDQPIKDRPAAPRSGQYDSVLRGIDRALAALPPLTISTAYQAWLGFYNSHLRKLRWSQTDLVSMANHWVMDCVGAEEPPSLMAKTVSQMGLKGVPGLRVEGRNGVPTRDHGHGGRGFRGGGNRGGGGGEGRSNGSGYERYCWPYGGII